MTAGWVTPGPVKPPIDDPIVVAAPLVIPDGCVAGGWGLTAGGAVGVAVKAKGLKGLAFGACGCGGCAPGCLLKKSNCDCFCLAAKSSDPPTAFPTLPPVDLGSLKSIFPVIPCALFKVSSIDWLYTSLTSFIISLPLFTVSTAVLMLLTVCKAFPPKPTPDSASASCPGLLSSTLPAVSTIWPAVL